MFIFGVVDRLDESLVLAEERLRHFFNKIDLSYIKQNVSQERADELTERLEAGRAKIGDKLMNELIERNKLDMLLFEYANKELDLRIKKTENFDKKLAELKTR